VWVARALVPLALLAWSRPAEAQEGNVQACHEVLREFYPAEAEIPTRFACQVLAGELVGSLTDDFWPTDDELPDLAEMTGAGDVQPTASGSSTAAGSAAQSEAVASGQPLGVGGGSVSLVGTDGGTDGITSLTFNPWIFFGGDQEAAARYSRLSDVTLYFPMNDVDGDDDGDLDYFGARLRVNLTGLSAGDEVWEAASETFESLLQRETNAAINLRRLLESMNQERMRACAEAIGSDQGYQVVEAECGKGLATPSEADYRAFQAALDRARVEADAEYFGLDLRVETGDPTLGAVENASVTSLNAGVSFGRQFVGEDPDPLAPSSGFRLRASARYAELTSLDRTSFAFEAGGAFVLKRPIAIDQALTLSGGLELRAGDSEEGMEAQFQSDYLSLRASLNVPVTRQTTISIAFGHPIWGDQVSRALSITGDWRLGLQELLSSAGS
jgi:hypothetical protein